MWNHHNYYSVDSLKAGEKPDTSNQCQIWPDRSCATVRKNLFTFLPHCLWKFLYRADISGAVGICCCITSPAPCAEHINKQTNICSFHHNLCITHTKETDTDSRRINLKLFQTPLERMIELISSEAPENLTAVSRLHDNKYHQLTLSWWCLFV